MSNAVNNKSLPQSNGGAPTEFGGPLRLRSSHLDVLRGLAIVPASEDALPDDDNASALGGGEGAGCSATSEKFDCFAAAGALRETLESANQIVEVMIRASFVTGAKPQTSLWLHVAECEKRATDILRRVVVLRRTLFR